MRGFPKEKEYIERELAKWQSMLSDMFEWTGTIDTELLELMLQNETTGYLVGLSVDEPIVVRGTIGGEPDYRNRPTKIIVANHVLGTHERTIHEDGCILRNNTMLKPIAEYIKPFLRQLYHIDLSLHKATIDTRCPYIATAPTETTRRAITTIMDKTIDGDFCVITDNIGLADGVKTLPYGNQNANTITTLMEERQFVVSQIWATFGIDVNNNMKREALNQGETHINEDSTKPLIEDMYNCRKAFCDEMNTIFGTDWSVDFSGVWKRNEEKEEAEIENLDEETTEEGETEDE